MSYIRDTLTWVTCYNPAKKMTKHNRLNFYGPTVIKSDGAIIAGRIFAAWASLLSNGPRRITLTGDYGWIEGESPESGKYSAIKADRDEVVERFKRVANFSRRVVESRNDLFILHLGI